jgi:hypothetical protein
MVLLASSYDQARFFKAADLDREKKFRIKSVTEELIGAEQEEKKLVVWFTNDERGLVLNKTNNRTIRGAFGDPVDLWVGKIIIIFPTMAPNRGKLVPALRVRIPPPKQTATAAPAPKVAPSGNGPATAPSSKQQLNVPQAAATASADPELDDEPPKSLADELDDDQF